MQLNHQFDLIRQKGEPLTLEELVPPPAPDGKDVTSLYRRAQTKIHFAIQYGAAPPDDPEGKASYSAYKYIPTYTNKKETAAYLAKNAMAIKLIRQASAEPNIRFDLDLDPYLGASVKGVNDFDLIHLISLQAIYEAHAGNSNAALQDVRCLFLMAQQFSTIPDDMSVAHTYIKTNRANDTLSKVLLYTKFSSAQVKTFESSLPVINLKALAYRDFLVDRIMSIYNFEYFAWPEPVWEDTFPAETSLLKWRGILKLITIPLQKLDETCALKLWPITYNRSKNAPFPMPPNYQENQGDKLVEELSKQPLYAIGTRFTPFILPDGIPGQIEIARRERIIALALAAYHTQYHQYPSTLTSLEKYWGSALSKDLYSGKAFRYHSNGKTFHLYSVGNDRKDDGGQSNSYPRKDDIEWQNNSPAF
ncbi:MAG: hypothetical protein ABI210_13715 [Abditibacteriaceae bacterium]